MVAKSLKPFLFSFLIIFSFISLLSSCQYRQTKNKAIEFNVKIETIDSCLKTLIQFENANIEGLEVNVNSVITNIVHIKIVNGINIPTNQDELTILAKKIAAQMKQEVKNINEFKKIRVTFAKESRSESLNTTKTTAFDFNTEIL